MDDNHNECVHVKEET